MNRHLVTALAPVALLAAVSLADAHGGRHGPTTTSFRPTTFATGSSTTFKSLNTGSPGHTSFGLNIKPLTVTGSTFNHTASAGHASSGVNIKPLTVTGSTFNHKLSNGTPFSTSTGSGRHATLGSTFARLPKFPATVKLPLKSGNGGQIQVGRYASVYGVKFRYGIYFRGLDHQHWTRRCYCPQYSCWCWFCPSTSVWYYWCAPRGCYLPVTCLRIAPPAPQAADITQTDAPDAIRDVPEVDSNELPELPQK